MAPRRPSANSRGPQNPLGPSHASLVRGESPFTPGVSKIERGTVVSVDATRYTYHVVLNSGRSLPGIARIMATHGDTTLLPIGTMVAVTHGLGEPYIIGVLPFQGAQVAAERPDNVTGTSGHGGEDPVLNRNFGTTARAPGDPRDLMPGDVLHRSPDGAAVGALHGKLALLKGSSLAQIVAHGQTDQVDIIAGLLRVITWMGESRYVNDEGKTSYQWRGGADQLTETGADENKYTLRLDVGHSGDLFNFEVTTPQGQSLFRLHVDPNGRLSIASRGGWEWTSGADRGTPHPQRIHGGQQLEVEGAQQTRVAGPCNQTYEADRETTVSSNDSRIVGQDAVERINRDLDVNVGGTMNHAVTGDVTRTSTTGNMKDELTQGNYENRVRTGTWKVQCDVGNASIKTTGGKFRVENTRPDSVELTGNPRSHAVTHEELSRELTKMNAAINQKMLLLATHVHPPGAPAPSPTLAPLTNPYIADWTGCRSAVVKL